MSIIFLVLKIIILILISIITLFLIAGIFLLAVPLRYKVYVEYHKEVECSLQLSWLLKFISFKFIYSENNKKNELRILGILLGKRKKTLNTSSKKEEKELNQESKEEAFASEEISELNEQKSYEKINEDEEKDIGCSDIEEENNKPGILGGINNIWEKVKYYYNYPDREELIRLSKDFIIKSFKTIRTKKFIISGEIGLESPDTTAYVIGTLSIINAWIKRPFYIEVGPDFQEEKIELKLNSQGRIYLGILSVLFIRFILRKPVWKLIKKYFL